ncbi:MAG: fatty acyl-AMP ligase [Solirubrobacteraceae bacterium]|nr:fatty acyl-AMP ligase [Solirubrobacteraceae bacterium]
MSATHSRPTRLPSGALEIGSLDAFTGDYIEHWTAVQPQKTAVTFIDYFESRKGVEYTINYAELDTRTRAIAARIAELTQPGDRVALLAPQSVDYVTAFAGALRSHAINVPLYAPDLPGHGDRLQAVIADCKPTAVLTTAAKADLVREFCAAHGGPADTQIIVVDELSNEDELADRYTFPDISLDDVAYLQYTSGSTRLPAGVVLTHRNLMVNVWQLINGHALNPPEPTCVSWLPLFHDMGLLLGAAGPVVGGAHSVLIDPVAFILKPLRWLQAASGRPEVITAAPNFAYDYAVKRVKPDDRAELDLSGVVSWANGAEPILPSTLDAFEAAFGPVGVQRKSLRPTYGLAEATVLVSVTPPGEEPTIIDVDAAKLQQGIADRDVPEGGRAVPLVSSGKPAQQFVAIVDPDTRERLPEGSIGEIWANGDNIGQGYWEKTAETQALFGAVLENAGDLPTEGWLRTEDLGVVIDGYLFVTGRIKDLIIVDGRNIYPHDIEYSVEQAHDAIAQRRLAAFSVPTDAGEAMVVVAEKYRAAEHVGSQLSEIAAAAREAVSLEHSVALYDFVLVEPDTISRTSSGKIARKATRASYLEGTLQTVPSSEEESA